MDIPLNAKVRASDGQIGLVGGLISDESGETVTHLIVLKGRRRGKVEVTLALSAVDRVEGDTVYLKARQGVDRATAHTPAQAQVRGR